MIRYCRHCIAAVYIVREWEMENNNPSVWKILNRSQFELIECWWCVSEFGSTERIFVKLVGIYFER